MGTGVFIDAVTGTPKLPLALDLIPVLILYTSRTRVYGVEGFAAGVGLAVELFRELGILRDYAELDRAEHPPHDVYVLPVLAGLRTPYAPWLGLVVAIPYPTASREEFVRALAHGVALTAAALLRRVASYVKDVRTVRVGGGLARSLNIVRLLANYSGYELEVVGQGFDSARGVALLAGYACGKLGWHVVENPPVKAKRLKPASVRRDAVLSFYKLLRMLGSSELWYQLRSYLDLLSSVDRSF
jgi:glycerol kinase